MTQENSGIRMAVVGSVHASFRVKNGYSYPGNLTLNYERGTIRTVAEESDGGATGRRVDIRDVDITA